MGKATRRLGAAEKQEEKLEREPLQKVVRVGTHGIRRLINNALPAVGGFRIKKKAGSRGSAVSLKKKGYSSRKD